MGRDREPGGDPSPPKNRSIDLERSRQALDQVHEAVWGMLAEQDLLQVLEAARSALDAAGIPFLDCEINLLDPDHDPPRMRSYNLVAPSDWKVEGKQGGLATLLGIWRRGVPAYRPDLEATDTHGEHGLICSLFGHPVRAVLDVPFSRGTLALNSGQPHAFGPADIAFVQELARLLSDGFRRLEDLQRLGGRTTELELSERRYRQLLADLPVGIVHTTPEGRFRYCNPHFARMVGYSTEALLDLPARDLYAEPAQGEATVELLAAQPLLERELPLRHRDGQVVWARAKAGVRQDEQGNLLYSLIIEDISAARARAGQEQVLGRVRDAIWTMRASEDIAAVMTALHQGLRDLGIPFDDCSVHWMDQESEVPVLRIYKTYFGSWHQADEHQPGPALITRLWLERRIAYRPDLENDDPFGERERLQRRLPLRSVIDLPFAQGSLALSSVRPHAYSPAQQELLTEFAGLLEEGFGRMEDLRALEHRALEAEALAVAIGAVAGSPGLEEALEAVVQQAALLMGCPRARLLLYDADSGLLVHRAATGFDWEQLRQVQVAPEVGWAGQAFRSGTVCANNDPNSPGAPPRDAAVDALVDRARRPPAPVEGDLAICVPVVLQGRPVGVLAVGGRRQPFGARDQELLLRLTDQAGLAVERSQAQEERELALLVERVHRVVLEMEQVEDFDRVFPALLDGLQRLGADLCGGGINLIDEAAAVLRSINALFSADGQVSHATNPLALEANQQLLAFWRRGEVWERAPDATFADAVAGPFGPGYTPITVIDVPFAEGTVAIGLRTVPGRNSRWIRVLVTLAPLISLGYQRTRDLQLRHQATVDLQVDLSLERVRTEIRSMETDADWEHVLQSVARELSDLITFSSCGIQLVDLDAGLYHPFLGAPAQSTQSLPLSIRLAMAEGRPVYRRNREEMRQMGDDHGMPAAVCSVVDVPFAAGTIALNSTAENAFTPEDIGMLERFARVLSEAHRRLQDLHLVAQTRQELQQAQRLESIGRLTAGIAHNFNNLLQANLANIALARMSAPPKAQEYLDDAREAGERGAALVRDLMLFSKSRTAETARSNLDLGALITTTLSLCRRTIDRRIDLQAILPGSLPPVHADSSQIQQVLLNLYLNARDALEAAPHPQPRICTAARLVQATPPGQHQGRQYLAVEVSDNGIGMDAATRERIFDPFFTTKEVGKGTGLGLATVYGILQQHSSWIECRSEPGQGTAFTFFLPTVPPAPTVPEASRPTAIAGGDETLLIVDDETLVRQSTARIFAELGYRVLEAEGGEEALRLYQEHPEGIDLVLLDLSMPGLSGTEVLRRLRDGDPGAKVLVFTGYAVQASQLEGAVEVIGKPFSLARLAGAVRRALDG